MSLRICVFGQKGMWRVCSPGLSWVLPGAAAGQSQFSSGFPPWIQVAILKLKVQSSLASELIDYQSHQYCESQDCVPLSFSCHPPISLFLFTSFSLSASPSLFGSLSDVFQDITGDIASLLSTGYTDEATMLILTAHTNLGDQDKTRACQD